MKANRVFEQGGNVVKKNAGLGEVRDFANQALKIHSYSSINEISDSNLPFLLAP
jgi:hypothetical protein